MSKRPRGRLGGQAAIVSAPNVPGYLRGTDDAKSARIAAFKTHNPIETRDGVYLHTREVYDMVLALETVEGLEARDLKFLEDCGDRRRAYAEVGRRWKGSYKQAQWLTDIYRRLSR